MNDVLRSTEINAYMNVCCSMLPKRDMPWTRCILNEIKFYLVNILLLASIGRILPLDRYKYIGTLSLQKILHRGKY